MLLRGVGILISFFFFLRVIQVLEGMDVLMAVGSTRTDNGDRPLQPVVIEDSGVLPKVSPFEVSDDPNESVRRP